MITVARVEHHCFSWNRTNIVYSRHQKRMTYSSQLTVQRSQNHYIVYLVILKRVLLLATYITEVTSLWRGGWRRGADGKVGVGGVGTLFLLKQVLCGPVLYSTCRRAAAVAVLAATQRMRTAAKLRITAISCANAFGVIVAISSQSFLGPITD